MDPFYKTMKHGTGNWGDSVRASNLGMRLLEDEPGQTFERESVEKSEQLKWFDDEVLGFSDFGLDKPIEADLETDEEDSKSAHTENGKDLKNEEATDML